MIILYHVRILIRIPFIYIIEAPQLKLLSNVQAAYVGNAQVLTYNLTPRNLSEQFIKVINLKILVCTLDIC